MESTAVTPHAYVPSRLAVKSSHPQIADVVTGCKITNKIAKVQIFRQKSLLSDEKIYGEKLFMKHN